MHSTVSPYLVCNVYGENRIHAIIICKKITDINFSESSVRGKKPIRVLAFNNTFLLDFNLAERVRAMLSILNLMFKGGGSQRCLDGNSRKGALSLPLLDRFPSRVSATCWFIVHVHAYAFSEWSFVNYRPYLQNIQCR